MKKSQLPDGISLLESSKGTKKTPYKKSSAVKYLESLIVEAKRARYPSIPADYIFCDFLSWHNLNFGSHE